VGRDLAADSDHNFWAAWRSLATASEAGSVVEDDELLRVRTGSPIPSFNPVFVKAVSPSSSPGSVVARASAEAPFELTVRESSDAVDAGDVARAAFAAGLADDGVLPGMALGLDTAAREAEVGVIDVGATGRWVDYFGILSAAFDLPLDAVAALADPDAYRAEGWTALLGEVDGVAVATSAAFVTGDVCGVYNVGTTPALRGKGYGEALTWAAVDVGRRAGCEVAVLQASEMGLPVYERMGFAVVAKYRRWR